MTDEIIIAGINILPTILAHKGYEKYGLTEADIHNLAGDTLPKGKSRELRVRLFTYLHENMEFFPEETHADIKGLKEAQEGIERRTTIMNRRLLDARPRTDICPRGVKSARSAGFAVN